MGTGRKSKGEWLRYHLAPLKDEAKKELLLEYGDPPAVFSRTPSLIAGRAGVSREQAERFLTARVDVGQIEERLGRCGGGWISWGDTTYPILLREWFDPPAVLFYRGDLAVLEESVVAVVGARKADRGASEWTFEVARSLARARFAVGSGLALGIDGAAHRGALGAGGKTVAVIGTGLDQVYPRFHHRLGEEIAGNGLILTEYPPGTPSYPANFPRRNRILAGISVAVLIAQASDKSGASITGRLALEGGRDLYILAAPPWDKRFAGNARFALEGAPVVQDGDDLVVRLGRTPVPPGELGDTIVERLSEPELDIVRALEESPTDISSLGRNLDLPAREVLALLMKLELEGLVVEGAGKVYRMRARRSLH